MAHPQRFLVRLPSSTGQELQASEVAHATVRLLHGKQLLHDCLHSDPAMSTSTAAANTLITPPQSATIAVMDGSSAHRSNDAMLLDLAANCLKAHARTGASNKLMEIHELRKVLKVSSHKSLQLDTLTIMQVYDMFSCSPAAVLSAVASERQSI